MVGGGVGDGRGIVRQKDGAGRDLTEARQVSFSLGSACMRTIETTVTVTPDGRLLANVPTDLAPGEHRVVLVIEEHATAKDEPGDLLAATSTTLTFWDNPYDDED